MLPFDDHEKMLSIVREAEKERDTLLCGYEKRAKRFAGEHARGDDRVLDLRNADPVNHAFEYLSLMIPRWVYTNPEVKVSTDLAQARQVAKAIQHALNRWADEVRLDAMLRCVAIDYGFYWGVLHVTPQWSPTAIGEGGMAGGWRPKLTRIDPRMFVIDPHCDVPHEARFMGHVWIADVDDFIEQCEADEDGGWDMAMVRTLSDKPSIDLLPEGMRKDRINRNEIAGYDLWIREAQPDPELEPEDGFHGAIVTIVPGVGVIREPTPFYGPSCGPYEVFGAYARPSSPFPLSPLEVTEPQESFLNTMMRAGNRAAEDYRRIVIVPQGHEIPYDSLPDGTVVEVPGMKFDTPPFTLEIGGVTDQQLRQVQYSQQQLERVSGMDEARRGNVTGDGTATEHAIADQAAENRSSFVTDQFAGAVQRVLLKAGWYIHNDGRVVFSLSPEAASAVAGEDVEGGTYRGGPPPAGSGEPDIPFEALDLSIVPMSMQRTSEPVHQRNVMQAFQVVMQIAPLIRQFPEAPWREWLDRIGDALNIPDMSAGYNFDLAQQLAQAPDNASPPALPSVTLAPEKQVQRPATEDAQRRGGVASAAGRTQ
jgi:hypothetical protein